MWKIFGTKEKFDPTKTPLLPLEFEPLKKRSKIPIVGEGSSSCRIICISDTHSKQWRVEIPKGDIFIHAGDLINYNEGEKHFMEMIKWLDKVPCKEKIIIGGNHDTYMEKHRKEVIQQLSKINCKYLENEFYQIKNLDNNNNKVINVYGSPNILGRNLFYLAKAFSVEGERMSNEWKKISGNTDILVTHCPPWDIFDETYKKEKLGSKELRNEIVGRIRPKIHIFGHNHDAPRKAMIWGIFDKEDEGKNKCLFVNASVACHDEPCIIDYKY